MKKPAKKSPAKPKIKPVTEKLPKPTKPEQLVLSPVEEQQQQKPPTPTQDQIAKPSRRSSITSSVSKNSTVTSTSQNVSSNIIRVASPQRGTSLLLSNNLPKQQQQLVEVTTQQQASKTQVQISNDPQSSMNNKEQVEQSKEDKEINEALQAIIQNRVSSPTIKTSK